MAGMAYGETPVSVEFWKTESNVGLQSMWREWWTLYISVLTAIIQVDLGLPVPECLHSRLYWS